jgi:hypothetical protein
MANHNKEQHVVFVTELTPALWDEQYFASLTSDHKKEVISALQGVQKCFQNTYEAVDKGTDAFWESLGIIIQIYSQITKTFGSRSEVCFDVASVVKELEVKLPMIKALEILPSAKEVFDAATRFLPTSKENMTEQDMKRAMNKTFRNKETKIELKRILKKQCDYLNNYVTYINTHYAQEVAELEEIIKVQMQEFLSKMQELQG